MISEIHILPQTFTLRRLWITKYTLT